jgi:hypothetical protein
MRNSTLALLVTVAIAVVPVVHAQGADNKVISVDYGIETSTDSMLLPSSTLGAVVLTCPSCAAHSYQLTNETSYFIGDKPATFAAFGAFLKTAGSRGATLFVKPDGKAVTRIRVSALAAAPASAPRN